MDTPKKPQPVNGSPDHVVEQVPPTQAHGSPLYSRFEAVVPAAAAPVISLLPPPGAAGNTPPPGVEMPLLAPAKDQAPKLP